MLKKIVVSPVVNKAIKPVNPKGKQPWIFFGRTDAETEATIVWPPDVKSRLIRKDLDAGKDWGREEKGWQRMKWLDGIIDSMGMSVSKLREMVKDRGSCVLQSLGLQRVRYSLVSEQQQSVP